MTILFQTKAELTQASIHSHLTYTFYVPEESEALSIDFHFSPDTLENNEAKQKAIISEAFTRYNLLPEQNETDELFDKYSPLKNLLTLSVDDSNGFRGARHCHASTQHVLIAQEASSPGMLNGSLPSGLWSVTISVHAIVTDMCQFSLTIKTDKRQSTNPIHIPWQNPMHIGNIPENLVQESGESINHKASEYKWVAAELHAHTFHSDGQQTVPEMVEIAEQQNLDVLAITDHNTTSPLHEMEEQRNKTSLQLLYGLEWTTFFGHMLTFGYSTLTYTDWRKIGPTDVHKGLAHIHNLGAIAGIAHPFRIGNPIGTGCHWEFQIEDIHDFDFMEVWNGNHPSISFYNQKALDFWTALLNKGYRMPATAGRDWHHNNDPYANYAITYVHMPKNSDTFRQDFLQSIREGRISISYQAVLMLKIKQAQTTYTIGDTVRKNSSPLKLSLEMQEAPEHAWYKLVSNKGLIMKGKFNKDVMEMPLDADSLTWIRGELYNKQEKLIAFTNPIYFQ
ncbi:CehA/McbA family metallohydrolase [Gracilibacillus suaedae]|uniref:CehA/McbA family metallohydrolase n=1 Tax=Gracilibacillus suaedae TaxID=2820273 RepID=UPI001ABDB225|nr:CehA/McbA family metallohydrolase [Gracilibacillus suaedae]